MKVKTFEAQYELIEFNHYIDHSAEDPIYVLDIVVESNDIDFIKHELNNIFIINTGDDSYVFTNYELTECYEIGKNLIRVICVK